MATLAPMRELSPGQIWHVCLSGKFDFIGEFCNAQNDAAAFVIHAVLGENVGTARSLLGQVIVVPRQVELWGFISGPR